MHKVILLLATLSMYTMHAADASEDDSSITVKQKKWVVCKEKEDFERFTDKVVAYRQKKDRDSSISKPLSFTKPVYYGFFIELIDGEYVLDPLLWGEHRGGYSLNERINENAIKQQCKIRLPEANELEKIQKCVEDGQVSVPYYSAESIAYCVALCKALDIKNN